MNIVDVSRSFEIEMMQSKYEQKNVEVVKFFYFDLRKIEKNLKL